MFSLKKGWLQTGLIIYFSLWSMGCFSAKPIRINLLPNGELEQVNSEPIVFDVKELLPKYIVPIDEDAQIFGISLPETKGIYNFELLPLQYTFNLDLDYMLEITYLGHDGNAPLQAIYILEGTNHKQLFTLPVRGDGKTHTVRARIAFPQASKNNLIIKKMASRPRATNPILTVKFIPIVSQKLPMNWNIVKDETAFAYVGMNEQRSRSGKYSVVIGDALTDNCVVGLKSGLVSVGRQEYEVSTWFFPTHEKVQVQLGVEWYKADNFLREDLVTGSGEANNWQQLVMEISPPTAANYGRIFVKAKNLKNAQVWFDDIFLLGDPTILPRLESLPITFDGRVGAELLYTPENGFEARDFFQVNMRSRFAGIFTGMIRFGGLNTQNKFSFTSKTPRRMGLNTTEIRLAFDTPIYPTGSEVNVQLGVINIDYSPYIALLSYTIAGGQTRRNGIKFNGNWRYGSYSSFSIWETGKQIMGAKVLGNLSDTRLDFTAITLKRLLPNFHKGVAYYLPEATLENATSLIVNRKVGGFNLTGTYNTLWQANNPALSPRSGILNIERTIMPGLNTFLSYWYCDLAFDPSYHDQTPRRYSESEGVFYEGNWVDLHRGYRGVDFNWEAGNEQLKLKGAYEVKKALVWLDNIQYHKFLLNGTIKFNKNELVFNWEQRNERRFYIDTIEQRPTWQSFGMTIKRPFTGLSGRLYDVHLSCEVEEIYNEKLFGQEIRFLRREADGLLKGLSYSLGCRMENDGINKQGYLKISGSYVTPGGLNLRLSYSNPNKPHTGYFDEVREKYIPADNEFIMSLSTWF